MREVNFSIPTANKASVAITAALYDRRALDCTSTLPLINSLNHLTYLTNSSARIREILTIDGGVERLVYILKQGRSKDMMDTWKWNLAFHCVVNIGVRGSDPRGSSESRGSETIRTRVVEADIVPVLATILDNYMKALDKVRGIQGEMDGTGEPSQPRVRKPMSRDGQRAASAMTPSADPRMRTPSPVEAPPVDVVSISVEQGNGTTPLDTRFQLPQPTPTGQTYERRNLNVVEQHHRHHHHHHVRGERRQRESEPRHQSRDEAGAEPFTRPRNPVHTREGFTMPRTNTLQRIDSNSSRPETPITPTFPLRHRTINRPRSASAPFPAQTIRQQDPAMSGDSSDGDNTAPVAHIRNPAPIQEIAMEYVTELSVDALDASVMLNSVDGVDLPAPDVTGDMDAETFNIRHRTTDGSIIDPVTAPPNTAMDLSPAAAQMTEADLVQLTQPPQMFSPPMVGNVHPGFYPSFPRDEDVILALQLLAYVSKYPALRPYFQRTHLVPKLKIDRELCAYDGIDPAWMEFEDDNENEYCQENDYNIFPLVEKFTVRHHASDVVYWAGIVMRNLCRKDKSRGDIRQCAYYKCGRWEEYAREFAKCRRCRQTKYCSKECQKAAWVFHRHWCEPANEGQKSTTAHACPLSEAA